ncbi:bifunctional 5,10-methylene-tetrahydrofolate dehydrogenase/5,10-methylene-tetrahydrofolate cyclohydrolase [Flavobacteriaceae bacterium]|uniref:bifunctional 5,10-methylenetetrahydrofolate dehydrogenase/5,10-methenyltetrahydrofolate cyclohydrolase n=1 Tax=Candidatus Arcticimaribacter forsetii TaxID=2820661 RepID=UPI00207714F3|nr:tetrahydrofolate dehydrogenase/cyclohydrolase catalytic domain-containing protein [Candidatus Arcticimaribacter forsetii]MDA8699390.1 bifunctional 5,10-methylene-tetrahydrofolate dehydrogenase/5,10-methylene-tetrahydrofolate cyclohydrolase [Flavobacteriaceae bacterium]MDB2329153.1 bifunctional 5,10-methylene-tetrahydrofolate dehydrogenase/5,10-methylene-tetrahydrofolate cyclohydrolase [Flavobacteriaceae bacterium]MDB2346014.1 bifunctional 5,10-methylene-tetrahydrofolate dehydrogenase/5,10-met
MTILDGKKTSQEIKEEIKVTVTSMKERGERVPHLAAVLVGNDGASLTYVGSKVRSCEQIGFESTLIRLEEEISEEELLLQIDQLNKDKTLDGYIVQLPLPKHINEERILLAIDPKKDVDGFHPANFGRMALDLDAFIPATPFGIIQLLERYEVPTSGKHCVVVGRSHIVGRPISILMSQKGPAGDATVTVAHSRTKNLSELTKQADIIVMALGIPEYLTADMVKEGATIIDVGITRVADESHPKGYVIKGDVAFDEVAAKSSFITPVPGGVGPMTIAMLLKNTLLARQWNQA